MTRTPSSSLISDALTIPNICVSELMCMHECLNLLVDSYSVQSVIHYVHPAVFWSQDKQRHQSLKARREEKRDGDHIETSHGKPSEKLQTEAAQPKRNKEKKRRENILFQTRWSEILASLSAHLSQVVEVVLVSDPLVVGLQTVGLVGDVPNILSLTNKELPLEELGRETRTRPAFYPNFKTDS